MKKLMFVAAIAASCVAVADNVAGGFDADDGIYNVTITEKTLALSYVQECMVYPDEGEYETGFESKSEAKKAAQEDFDEVINAEGDCTLKAIYVKKIDGEWGYQIKYTQNTDDVTGAKVVNGTFNGILVKGDILDGAEDGALLLWNKDKNARNCEGFYQAYSMTEDQAEVVGSAVANKAVGGLRLSIYEGALEANAAGMGTSTKDADGDYTGVKTLSGNIATTLDSELKAYGTWRIQKDATATKLAAKGYSLGYILGKKGAVEVYDAE